MVGVFHSRPTGLCLSLTVLPDLPAGDDITRPWGLGGRIFEAQLVMQGVPKMGECWNRQDIGYLGVWASTDVIRGQRGLGPDDVVNRWAPAPALARASVPEHESRAESRVPVYDARDRLGRGAGGAVLGRPHQGHRPGAWRGLWSRALAARRKRRRNEAVFPVPCGSAFVFLHFRDVLELRY